LADRSYILALVRASQAGDDLAFADLVCAHQDIAVAYATSILGDYQLAEDVAQEAFVDAYRRLPSLREPAAFYAWFRTILFKYCDRMMRRKQHRMAGLDAAQDVASSEPSPHESLESQDRETLIRQAVAGLTDVERPVVLLYYMGEHSHSRVAELLDVTTNVVKTRLYSARRRLKKNINEIERSLRAARPSSDQRFARRVMAAALPLQLYFLDANGDRQPAGSTVGPRTAEVPDANTWLIEPRRELTQKDWDTVVGLMREMQIPGLGASGQLTDSLLERISRLKHITYLDLSHCPEITDKGLRHLAELPRLERLDLSCPQVTDHGLEFLRHLPQLKTFELRHQNWVSDAGLASLAHCENLECVNVMGTPTGDGVIKALIGKPSLSHLFVGTNVTDAGLRLLRMFPVFKKWRGGTAAMSLLAFRAHPNYLWLNLKAPLTNQGLAELAGLEGLSALNLFGGTAEGPFDARRSTITHAGLRYLAGLPRLAWFGCNANLCTDEAMHEISAMPRLRFLMCQDAVAGDKGFAALSRSRSIEYVWGRRCYALTGSGFSSLAEMPALQGLSVSCRNVGEDGLSALPRFPALKELMPMDVSDYGFRHVGRCEQLEALHCMYCEGTSDIATERLTGLRKLKKYQAWGTQITDHSLEILGRMQTLEHLLFYECDAITDSGLAFIARLPRLREVSLECLRQVTVDAAAIFPAGVRVNYLK
jgi:RNA polymerase sigma factor (sigma-70 family)